jgi:DNA-binding MarR family transcriptional regulator
MTGILPPPIEQHGSGRREPLDDPGAPAPAASPMASPDPSGNPSDGTPLSLKSFLPYRLNILAQTVSAGFAVAYSEAFGITAPEWRILSTLGEFRQMTAKEIGDHSRMHKATVSRAVLSLDKRELLRRTPSAADRREEILSLTAEGRELYETIAPMALRYERGLLEGLSDEDIAQLDRLIRHIMERATVPWFGSDDANKSGSGQKS